LLLLASAALTILFAQAQTLCDPNMTYTTGSQYQLEIAIPVTGNSLPTMAPLYAVTYGDGNMLAEDSCFSGPCTHMIYNYNPNGTYYDTLTTCISYTLTDTVGYVDTLMCCFSQYWDGSSWVVPGGAPTPSWDCPTNMPGGCYDPGTGNGQYATLAACQAVCGTPTPSWDCDPVSGCYDPNNGLGQYTTLASCQSICQSQIVSPCDSIDIVGSQSQLTMEVMSGTNVNSPLYIVTTDFNGYIVGEDSLTWTHDAWPIMALTDSIITCITYVNGVDTLTCCVEFFWNGSFWARMGSVTSIEEIGLFDKKLIKVVDMLGRETSINSNQTLFFIYEDGLIEKRYIIDRK
ncbi:hypothetical protein N9D80_03570, partial [Flavobacteriales bacterium]|nr:hypothetical protein [Flavobacteriales bacterium]